MVVVAVVAPDVPVMVTVAGPVVAVLAAVSVSTLVDVVGLVPNAAVTPLGRPEAERVTLPVNPPEGVTVIVSVPLAPWATERVVAEAERVKPGVPTVSLMVVLAVVLPDVPVIVMVDVPAAAVLEAASVTTLVEVVGLVPNVAVTPLGRPEAERVTLPVNPPEGVTVIVSVALPPRVTVTL
jgi:hypothetical protein